MTTPNSELPIEDAAAARTFAGQLDIEHAVHPKDFIYSFLVNNPVFAKRSDAIKYYFHDGNNSVSILRQLLSDLGLDPDGHFHLLEFASGYGCVTRNISKSLPNATLLSCDIHKEAVNFIQQTLKQNAVLSHACPEMLAIREQFDVVFALSFFSHLPRTTWLRWLHALYARVQPNGHLIFTTQGTYTASKYFGDPQIPDDGFWYLPESEQKDLDPSEYGQTVVTKQFVVEQVEFLPSAELTLYKSSFWWQHQDLYVVSRKLTSPLDDSAVDPTAC